MARTPAVVVRWLVVVVICCCTTTHLLLLLPTAEAIWLNLPSSGTKCVSEEIQNNVVVLADYGVVGDETHRGALPTISASVTSPFGNNLHRQENVTHGQFAFTAKEAGNYGACFWVDGNHQGGQDVPVSLEWRIGVDAKDWETVARKEKIEGVELELMKLEGAVQAIHQNLIYLKDSPIHGKLYGCHISKPCPCGRLIRHYVDICHQHLPAWQTAKGSRDEGSQRKNQFQSGVVQYNVPWCLHCCFGSAVVALEELLSKEKTDLGFHFIIMFLI
ncbi:unnamed protein product [Camellia sinensis]